MNARPNQLLPGGNWRTWLALAGRGFGKTRTGAETVREWAKHFNYVNLMGATIGDARDIMIEGESGILAICPKRERPEYISNKNLLRWPNGGKSLIFTADKPERMRGKQHSKLWCFIAGTKILTEYGAVDLETLKINDLVQTRSGLQKIIATGSHLDKVGIVRFSNGATLTGTSEHPVLTSHGWTRLSELRIGDKVCIGQSAQMATLGPTSEKLENMANVQMFTNTAIFGNSILERFQMATKYIIKMATSKITPLKTWKLFQKAAIQKFIVLKPQYPKLIIQKDQVFCSNVDYATTKYQEKNNANLYANLANIKKPNQKDEHCENVKTADAILSQGSDIFAVSVVSTWAHVGNDIVYNITVENTHEYFANGILVHNCDELAAWRYLDAYDQAMLGLRLGKNPQTFISTTPRPIKIIKTLLNDPRTFVTRGSTYDNKYNLAAAFLEEIVTKYEGTRLGRQELNAELLDDNPNSLWKRDRIDQLRVSGFPDDFKRIVVALDPAVTSKEDSCETGIIVAGLARNNEGYILEDCTMHGTADAWASIAIKTYHKWQADLIIGEANNGGDLIEALIRSKDQMVNYKKVHASRGKTKRAEPVAALYEQGRVHHVGSFPELEDQMLAWNPSIPDDEQDSPDRMDALVWALSGLMLKPIKEFHCA